MERGKEVDRFMRVCKTDRLIGDDEGGVRTTMTEKAQRSLGRRKKVAEQEDDFMGILVRPNNFFKSNG